MSVAANAKASSSPWIPNRMVAVKIALTYAVLGALWILGSGWLLHHLVHDSALEALLETFKGWFFVAVTALLLGVALDRYFRAIRQSAQRLQESEERLRLAGDNLPQSYMYQYQHEPDGKVRFTYVSAGVERVHGVCVADVLRDAETLHAQIDAAQRSAHMAAEAESARNLTDFEMDLRMRRSDGAERLIRVRSRPRRNGAGLIQWDGFAVDVTERKATEQEAERIAREWQTTFNATNDAIWILNQNHRVLRSNQTAERLFHHPCEQMIGKQCYEIVHGTAEPHPDCPSARARQSRRRETMELAVGERWLKIVVDPILDAAGEYIGAVHIASDITEHKQAEEALRHSEERYRGLVETTFDWIWEVDANARYTYASPKVNDLLGYRPEEVLGRTPFDLMPETEAQRICGVFQQIAAKREPFSALENINRHKDGHLIVLETSGVPVWGANGEFKGYRGMDRDVTERKRVETELKASEERFRRLVEMAPEAIFIRTKLHFVYLNAAALKLFGAASSDQLLGQSVLDRFPPDSQGEVVEHIQRLDEQGKAVSTVERVLLRLDGSPVHVILSAVPFRYQDQNCALVFARDVTELKRLEAQFRQAQKLEAIGQLAGGVAHDFNNILAATMMHLGLLQMNPALDAETRLALKELDIETRRAATLTRQLLMFSRRSVLAVKPLDLNEIVANLLKMLNRLIGEHIDLRFEGKGGLPVVEADAGMLEQVLMNLVVNARDAMPRGGRIIISTQLAELTLMDATENPERRPGRFVCLAVKDTGCGMDATTLKHMFEPFFTTKEAGRGTGLGLATVHGIVAQHKGWVEVASRVGQGTTFTVFLPAIARTEAGREAVAPVEPVRRGCETILLVEDDPPVRRMIGQSLRMLGYRVYEAGNGKEAMKLWQTNGPNVDLLLTDMVMPEGMTGLELTERLQGLKPGLKAIISSGYSTEMVQAGVPTKEGVIYLPKPYEAKKLADVVRSCLDQKT